MYLTSAEARLVSGNAVWTSHSNGKAKQPALKHVLMVANHYSSTALTNIAVTIQQPTQVSLRCNNPLTPVRQLS
jgi:hypothetical protein